MNIKVSIMRKQLFYDIDCFKGTNKDNINKHFIVGVFISCFKEFQHTRTVIAQSTEIINCG